MSQIGIKLKNQADTLRNLVMPSLGDTGNIGTFRLIAKNATFTPMFVAGSCFARDDLRDAVRQNFSDQAWFVRTANDFEEDEHGKLKLDENGQTIPSPKYRIYAHVTRKIEGEVGFEVDRHYNPSDLTRYNDSENLIINFAKDVLTYRQEVLVAELHLYTELPPCKSCKSIINQFATDHPEISVNVYYDAQGKTSSKNINFNLVPV